MKDSLISSTIDFQKDGVQHGFLKLPHSHDDSAWGSIVIPITVAKNGHGPTILFTGANHGDEYEGPVALFDLVNNIEDYPQFLPWCSGSRIIKREDDIVEAELDIAKGGFKKSFSNDYHLVYSKILPKYSYTYKNKLDLIK